MNVRRYLRTLAIRCVIVYVQVPQVAQAVVGSTACLVYNSTEMTIFACTQVETHFQHPGKGDDDCVPAWGPKWTVVQHSPTLKGSYQWCHLSLVLVI